MLGEAHLPPFPQKAIILLRGERYTRYFLLIINALYTKRGKSAPPSIKTLVKKCTCNPDIVKKSICHAFTIAPLYRPFREGREMGLTTALERYYNGLATKAKRGKKENGNREIRA